MRDLFVVLPIYNEEDNLGALIDTLWGFQGKIRYNIKIIAIDDNSTDGSDKVLQEKKKEGTDLEIITFKKRNGLSGSLQYAIKYLEPILSNQDLVLFIESDGTSDISVLPKMIEKIEKNSDLVIGSRYIEGGKYINFPFYRILSARIINFFLKTFWHIPGVGDYTILYRLHNKKLIKQLSSKLPFKSKKSFAFIGEMLLIASVYKTRISEIPVVYDYGLKKSKSKMNKFSTLWEYFKLSFI